MIHEKVLSLITGMSQWKNDGKFDRSCEMEMIYRGHVSEMGRHNPTIFTGRGKKSKRIAQSRLDLNLP